MRFVFVLLTMLLTAGMAAPTLADEVAPPGDPELTTPDGLTEDNYSQSADDAIPCGCGGPKAIYAAKYGTVQPPALQQQQQEREAAEAAAAAAEAAQSQ